MSPIGPYADFNECVAKNGDKASPEGFCAWLEHKLAPTGMSGDRFPEVYLNTYDAATVAGKTDADAFKEAEAAARAEGFELTRFGWVKQFQAPTMKKITGVKVFAAGTWMDSAGNEKNWTTEDLDKMVLAFTAGVPVLVPLKCGHTSDEFNRKIAEALEVPVDVVTGEEGQGQIKLGNMTSLQRKGDLAVAAFDNIPEPIANLIEGGQYSTVSVEIEDQVGDYGPVITGVALLGAEEPAVDKATLERALVFGGRREGARVLSFTVGEDIPVDTLRAEFDDIRGKIADIIKGKKGAPVFRALFGNLSSLFEQLIGNSKQQKGETMDFHTVEERLRGVRWAAQELGLNDKATIEEVVTALETLKAADADTNLSKAKGGNVMTLPKALQGKKPADIRAMSLTDLVKLFSNGDAPTVEELKSVFQEGDLAAIAAALGLGEGATVDDIVAAIKGLVDKAAEAAPPDPAQESEMAKKLAVDSTRLAVLEAEKSVRDWEDKTRAFTGIPGTPHEHAVSLAGIEGKAGKDAAETQFKALEEANRLAAEAQKIIGSSRTNPDSTDFDNEVSKYMAAHTDAKKVDAIKAVQKSHPDLYHARRDTWNQ